MAKGDNNKKVLNIEDVGDGSTSMTKETVLVPQVQHKVHLSAFYVRWILMVTAVVLVVALILGAISSLIEFNRSIQEDSKSIATSYVRQASQNLSNRLLTMQREVQNFAAKVGMDNLDAMELRDALVQFAKEHDGVARFRYHTPDGELFDQTGVHVNHTFGSDFTTLVESGEFGITGILNDPDLSIEVICIGVPVSNYSRMDYLVAIYPLSQIIDDIDNIYGMGLQCGSESYAIGLYSHDSLYAITGRLPHAQLDQVYPLQLYLTNIGTTSQSSAAIRAMLRHQFSSTDAFEADIGTSVVSVAPTTFINADLRIFALYQVSVISENAYNFLVGMIVVLVAMSVLLTSLVAYSVHCFLHRNKYEAFISALDPIIGCNTYEHYCYESSEYFRNDPYAKYAIVVLRYYYYQINTEDFGQEFMTNMLKYTAQTIDRFMKGNETFGSFQEGMFTLTMAYKDEDELINRLKLLYTVLYNYPEMRKKAQKMRPQFGIYLGMTMGKADIQTMVSHAAEAVLSKNSSPDKIFLYYSDAASEVLRREAEIESKMEGALAAGDFKLFFQPLYNVSSKMIDSSEVLVRWYDGVTGRYYMPAEFIELFNVNGFITKVDRYVIREVFKLQKDNILRHQRKIPLSVNVSAVTALEDGFVQFCRDMHAEYEVPYDYVIFEFPESFVYQNFDGMKKVMNEMKRVGFLCAVDGYGRAPYQVFKELQFYELKLDRYFLKSGRAKNVDEILIQNMITMSKALQFKIVQEGVETHEDFKRLSDLGVDAIQGYYYSKPLSYADFLDFANKDTPFGI